ncbi:unnamed protein product [Linum trigynum]|uniref:WRKY domain-containing protein n=2 Tax=Linum trigynum TaxID=586398 RepID=A0AAV2DXL5_9ROSI
MERQVGGRRDNAIQELLKGREFTCQLRLLLSLDSKGGCAEDLVGKILSTFTHTISLLNTTAAATATKAESFDEVSQLGPRKSESSSGDTDGNPSTSKNDRPAGCTKKRKLAASRSWVKESRTLVDDGYAWRKYGQKKILESDFPRHYYRCTHKFDQKCPATKQIQMLQDRPSPLYRTTYSAHHTCHNNTLHDSSSHQHFLMDSAVDSTTSCHLISFNNSTTTTTTPFLASFSGSSSAPTTSPPSVVKQQQESSLSDAASSGRQTLNQREAAAASGSSILSTAADDDDDENEKYDMSFIQMMIMDSVDDFQGLLG